MKLNEIHIRDPFVLVDDNKYYLYGSRASEASDICFGLDVYVSDDLENWSEPTEVFTRPENFWSDRNYWAPEVHKYKDEYYMFVSFKSETRNRGVQILKSASPMGPFLIHSDGPVTPAEWSCLDGTLYIEKGIPYMIFCHEWTQVRDGEMCVVELSQDLKESAGKPFLLFKASEPSWACGLHNEDKYVTDGPFIYKTENNRLVMVWSSFAKTGYCEAIAYSDNNSIFGKWTHDDRLLFEKDGGHGMIFKDLNDRLKFVCHRPNKHPAERPCFFELYEKDDTLYLKDID